VVFVLTSSALDALFTLLYIQRGGAEANPLMALALNYGIMPFVGLKMGLTGIGTVILATYERAWFGLTSLYLLAALYMGLLIYHTMILLSGF
jgi:hypothetical protein